MNTPPGWQALLDAPRSAFFRGHPSDTRWDRTRNAVLAPSYEALFTHSNARVLLGQAAHGALRFVALPTQVYPAPTGEGEFGLGPGMYHHFDVAMYAGDLSYEIQLDGGDRKIDLVKLDLDGETYYAGHFLPLTRLRAGDLEITLASLAPVAPDPASARLAPAPLPGPAGAIYAMRLVNRGEEAIRGKVLLNAGDALVGAYEDARPELRALKRPGVDLRQGTLILTRPDGAAGVHLHRGHWTRLEAPFQAERPLRLAPGEEAAFETHIVLGRRPQEIMPVVYELHMRPFLEWWRLTRDFWEARLGRLEVPAGQEDEFAALSRDVYLRCMLDNFNCLQTGANGDLIAHWQGAPSHGYGTVWGIDVEPTAVSILPICPELALQAMRFFLQRSRAPVGPADHSTPILVAPVVIARKWLQLTGEVDFFRRNPQVLAGLKSIMDDLLTLQAPGEPLFPTRYSSDGPVGRRYDYGTNAKVCYAFASLAYIFEKAGLPEEARRYARVAQEMPAAIERTMIQDGPFGPQISGGTNLGEDPGMFYLPEGVPYYDGEDTSSMLAPIYGVCASDSEPWVNYHRFARSLWCAHYDPEVDTLRWAPTEPAVVDGTALFSRLAGCLTPDEMRTAWRTLRQVGLDEVTGSVFWWPHGRAYKRSLTRCSQGQGAWAWHYLERWLGMTFDVPAHTLTLAQRGLLNRFEWQGCGPFPHRFDISWSEHESGASARVRNHNPTPWTVRAGFRRPGAGAAGPLEWQECSLEAGEEAIFVFQAQPHALSMIQDQDSLFRQEAQAFGDDGVIFRRYGPALLWGHWEAGKQWDFSAMPLALRFVVLNGTPLDWDSACVELHCPDGWQAQGRLPLEWPRPDHLQPGQVRLDLGPLGSLRRMVAAFWVVGPQTYTPASLWDGKQPFHQPTQPGEGVTLRVKEASRPEEWRFSARLCATSSDGALIDREIGIPVAILPVEGEHP